MNGRIRLDVCRELHSIVYRAYSASQGTSPVNGVVVGLEAFREGPLPAAVHHTEPLGDEAVVGQPRPLLATALDHHVAQFLRHT